MNTKPPTKSELRRALGGRPGKEEGDLQKACLQLLEVHRIPALRINSGTIKDRTGRPVSFARWPNGDPAYGLSDILLFIPYKLAVVPIWCELKSAGGATRKSQREFREWAEASGMTYIIIRDVCELEIWLRDRRAI